MAITPGTFLVGGVTAGTVWARAGCSGRARIVRIVHGRTTIGAVRIPDTNIDIHAWPDTDVDLDIRAAKSDICVDVSDIRSADGGVGIDRHGAADAGGSIDIHGGTAAQVYRCVGIDAAVAVADSGADIDSITADVHADAEPAVAVSNVNGHRRRAGGEQHDATGQCSGEFPETSHGILHSVASVDHTVIAPMTTQ